MTEAANVPILGQQACASLNLVQRIETIETPLTKEGLFQQYKYVLINVGEYKIELDKTVPPVIQPSRKVPYAWLNKLKQTLDSLEHQGVTANVDKPTDWVSNLVIVKRSLVHSDCVLTQRYSTPLSSVNGTRSPLKQMSRASSGDKRCILACETVRALK